MIKKNLSFLPPFIWSLRKIKYHSTLSKLRIDLDKHHAKNVLTIKTAKLVKWLHWQFTSPSLPSIVIQPSCDQPPAPF